MSTNQNVSRRSFVAGSLTSAGALAVATACSGGADPSTRKRASRSERLPREVWIASFCLQGIEARDHEDMIEKVLGHMNNVAVYQPDIVCLPETFPYVNNEKKAPPIAEIAEVPPGPVTRRFSEFARKNHCYVICPIYTREKGKHYNAAVLIDREGGIVGEYRKMRPAPGEVENGITPGPKDAPVFETDFGRIGIQICFDVKWQEGWRQLGEKGAEIVFWPSAFSGGRMIAAMAWMHQYHVVSSSWKDTTKICDVSGEELAWTGRWEPNWVCAPVNLEKAFLHAWPPCERFADVHARYGRKVRITTYHEEEWAIIESLSPEVKVADVLEEFGFQDHRAFLRTAENVHGSAS